ncbi:MAG: hypothetical protein HYZ18_09750 [Pseudogulbenkiania sp.]|nr:hypothetical protein [Pseudogulbenkiania sp.]
MTPQQRAIKKELLLMKGDALRLKLRMELKAMQRPLDLAGAGWQAWRSVRGLSTVFGVIGSAIPSKRLRRLLLSGARAFLLWQAARKIWTRL